MAIRTKTVEYAFDAYRSASLAVDTRFVFPTMSIYIPETGSRTFRSAFAEVHFRDNVTTGTNINSVMIGIKLGSAAFSDTTVNTVNSPGGFNNSGEHQSFALLQDLTSYFNTNFGSSVTQSCQVALQFAALTTNNHSVKLYLTYDYDDAADIRVKTVRIPIGSTPTTISNTLQAVGTGSVPALDTFLPEVGKAYRNIWFEIQGNDGSGTVDDYIVTSLDAETPVSSAIHERALGSAMWIKSIWKRDDMVTSTTHSFNIGSAAASAVTRYANMAVLMGVTYEYTHSLTSQSMNSLVIPLIDESGGMGDYLSDTTNYPSIINSSIVEKEFYISEPSPIVTKQSGLLMFYNATGGSFIRIKVNDNVGWTRYTRLQGTLACGQYSMMHRFDQVGVQGYDGVSNIRTLSNIFKLQRGNNKIKVSFDLDRATSTATTTATNASGIAYINYVSNKHPDGDAVHNQTRFYLINGHRTTNQFQQFDSTFAPTASLGSYYRNNAMGFGVFFVTGTTDGGIALTVRPTDAETGSGVTDSWTTLYESMYDISGERGIVMSYAQGISKFKRYPNDPDTTRMDLLIPRIYRTEFPGPGSAATTTTADNIYFCGSMLLWTYHNIYTAVTRSISGYTSGDGSGIPVSVYYSGSNELLYDVTTRSGGEYSFVAYDANTSLYATAYDSASGRAGSSRYFTPSV